MCTVTFIPVSTDGFILTSNRDESPGRNTLPPAVYDHQDVGVLYPKDELAGGTWIGASSENRLICLLNGGFKPHEPHGDYRISRGVMVVDLLTAASLVDKIDDYNFEGIEPFTIIAVEWKETLQIHELVWDGVSTHFTEQPLAPQIWSSSLLYPEEVKKKRERWFSDFLSSNIKASKKDVLGFHKTAGEGNSDNNLIMDRGFVKTKSISQFSLESATTLFRYEDLQTAKITTTNF